MLKPQLPYDRREFGRRRATVSARIRLADQTTLEGTVLNVSEGGALLDIPAADRLPPRFRLSVNGGMELSCEIRHRRGTRVGVEFTVAQVVATADSSAARDLVAFARKTPWGQDAY